MAAIEPIARMVAELSHLPGIGQKTAQRLAYHIVSMPLEDVRQLATALWQGRKAIRYCEVCGNYAEGEKCAICEDEQRKKEKSQVFQKHIIPPVRACG